MTNSTYTDISYPPVSSKVLQYHRGDGALIKVQVTNDALAPFDPTPPSPLVYTRHPDTPTTAPPTLLVPTTELSEPTIFDHPSIGGQFDVYVLLYGPVEYHPLHRRCLDALVATVPVGRMRLRVISNDLCQASVAYVEQLIAQGVVATHFRNAANLGKYPAMRKAFYDVVDPPRNKFIIWFDDDSIADRDQTWLTRLAETITANYPKYHMFGAEFYSQLSAQQFEFYKKQKWWRGKPLYTLHGRQAANGNKAKFCAGGCWCVSNEAMLACDIPADNLLHNGGDICVGVQLQQGGYDMLAWNGSKQFVNTSSVARRGMSQPHYGTPGYQQLRGGK